MFPYLDIEGFARRSAMPSGDIRYVEEQEPGFVSQQIATVSKFINSRLRKRYGNAPNLGNSLPFGRTPAPLLASGTMPPQITLTGQPVLGSMEIRIAIIQGGVLGVATFAWSSNLPPVVRVANAHDPAMFAPRPEWVPDSPDALRAGAGPGIITASQTVLGTTGITANFPAGTYGTDNFYASDTQVPEAILNWITVLVTPRVYGKRGFNPADPQIQAIREDAERALEEIKEAADSKDGLFDLPVSEDKDSAVTTAGPQFYSEQSPYRWMDRQAQEGTYEDAQSGFYGKPGPV